MRNMGFAGYFSRWLYSLKQRAKVVLRSSIEIPSLDDRYEIVESWDWLLQKQVSD